MGLGPRSNFRGRRPVIRLFEGFWESFEGVVFFRIFWLWDEEGLDTIFIWMGLIIIFLLFG